MTRTRGDTRLVHAPRAAVPATAPRIGYAILDPEDFYTFRFDRFYRLVSRELSAEKAFAKAAAINELRGRVNSDPCCTRQLDMVTVVEYLALWNGIPAGTRD